MAEVYVTLGEAAELERVKYNTMVKRVLRKQRHLMSFRWRLTPEILRQASQTFRSSSIHLWKMQSVIKSSAPEA